MDTQIGRCIYCGKEKEYSEEHHLPRCLGEFRDYKLLDNAICHCCNHALSKLDMSFCRTSTTGAFRRLLEIRGRRNEEPWDPFAKGFGYVPPVEIFDINGVRYEPSQMGNAGIRNMCQLVIYGPGDKIDTVVIPHWAKEDKDKMKRFLEPKLQGHDFDNVESITIHADEQERDIILNATNELQLFKYEHIEWIETPGGKEIKDVLFGSFITSDYMRAIAKIGFHYFLTYFPAFDGSDPRFEEIREFIRTGENIRSGRDIDRFVSFLPRPLSSSQVYGFLPGWSGHILAASADSSGYYAFTQFFIISKTNMINPSYVIRLGRNPYPLYYPRSANVAHRFEYFEKGKQGKYDGQVVETPRVDCWSR